MFLGLMTKHHLVHITPVAVSAKFCVSERFSTGRAKSLAPASTSDHCSNIRISGLMRVLGNVSIVPS